MIDALLSRLDKVRRVGKARWRALCPICGGSNATKLSIRERGDGGTLVFCFGCDASGPQVCEALGVDPAELFPARPPGYDDRKRVPRERAPFDARDAIRLIDAEINHAALLILVCSRDDLTPERRNRLAQAAHTIRRARAACGLRETT